MNLNTRTSTWLPPQVADLEQASQTTVFLGKQIYRKDPACRSTRGRTYPRKSPMGINHYHCHGQDWIAMKAHGWGLPATTSGGSGTRGSSSCLSPPSSYLYKRCSVWSRWCNTRRMLIFLCISSCSIAIGACIGQVLGTQLLRGWPQFQHAHSSPHRDPSYNFQVT